MHWTCSCDEKDELCDDYKCSLRRRIQRTCHGHLIWLYESALQENFSSHYWATGQVIESPKISSNLAKKSIMDIPLQIIKAADFCQIITDPIKCQDITNGYKEIFKRWIQDLHNNNKNNEYVFPRSMEKTTHKFLFAEHSIIWRALKSGEKFEVSLKVQTGKSTMSYSALDIQSSVLKKFSCKRPPSDEPMIAISRTPYGNKFKLRIQDTMIFYSMDYGLFQTSEETGREQIVLESWMNTLDHQMESWMSALDYQMESWKTSLGKTIEFDEGVDTSWSDPLQVALAAIISVKSKCPNSKLMKRIRENAKVVLLHSFSPNGLLRGQLDEIEDPNVTKELPDYHSYWPATFEIPYIMLWIYGISSPHADRPVSEQSSTGQSISKTTPLESTFTAYSDGSTIQFSNQQSHETKHINNEKIVEYSDEWLYSRPQLLTFQVDFRQNAMENFYRKNKKRNFGIVINNALKNMMPQDFPASIDPNTQNSNTQSSAKGYIINIPHNSGTIKTKDFLLNYIFRSHYLRRHIDLQEELGKNDNNRPLASTTSNVNSLLAPIKKRLMHFNQMDFELAMTCYYASPEAEDLSLFFDRHASYDKYFCEYVHLVVNKWTTEFHLSFYQVLLNDAIMPSGICLPR